MPTARTRSARTTSVKSDSEASEAPKPAKRVVSEAERKARARGFKGNAELAEQFQINDDLVRETVVVKELPTPPATESMVQAQAARSRQPERVNLEAAVLTIFSEAAEEVGERLEKFGIAFPPYMKQDMIDHLFALLAMTQQGFLTGGGALARR